MLFIACIFLQLMHQATDALNKIQFLTSINLLHVSTPGCQPQGIFQIKGTEAQHASELS